MATRYRLQPEAEKDLESIWHYTARHWGVKRAIQYIDELDEAFQLLADEPLICRERGEFCPPVRIHSHAKHLIVYALHNSGIKIVRVLHESMDIASKL